MKDVFPGHFSENEKNLKQIWNKSLFVFDANILLNLYRYSDSTRNELLSLLDKLKEKIWLPHRAAEEYLMNRLSVIDQQERAYLETIKSINSLKSDLENARQHPFVNTEVMRRVEEVFHALIEELGSNKKVHTNRIHDDEIKNSISKLFAGRVGSPYDKKTLEEIISEGEERFKQKIPPGFRDGSKSGESDVFIENCRKYGDLIVWKQVIDKSIDTDTSIILVTDDKKDDWWERFKGKTIGPHPDLVKEFKDLTKNSFHMYQADRFLELARENLNQKVSDEIVNEIREVRRRDKVAKIRSKESELFSRRKVEFENLILELEHSKLRLEQTLQDQAMLQQKLEQLEFQRQGLSSYKDHLYSLDYHSDNLDLISDEHMMLSKSCDELRRQLEVTSKIKQDLNMRIASLEKQQKKMKLLEEEQFNNTGIDDFSLSPRF